MGHYFGWVGGGEWGCMGHYCGWVRVGGTLFWVGGEIIWLSGGGWEGVGISGGEWGWLHCLIMPIPIPYSNPLMLSTCVNIRTIKFKIRH